MPETLTNFIFFSEDQDTEVQLQELYAKITRTNTRLSAKQQVNPIYLLTRYRGIIHQLGYIMGNYQAASWLNSEVKHNVLALERLLSSMQMLPKNALDDFKQYFADSYPNGIKTEAEKKTWQNCLQLVQGLIAMGTDWFYRGSAQIASERSYDEVKYLLSTDADKLTPADLEKKLCEKLLAELFLETDIELPDSEVSLVEVLLQRYTITQLSSLLHASATMEVSEYKDIYLKMLARDLFPSLGSIESLLHQEDADAELDIAKHNAHISQQLKKKGIEPVSALGFSESFEFVYKPEGSDAALAQEAAATALWSYLGKLQEKVEALLDKAPESKKLNKLKQTVESLLKESPENLEKSHIKDNLGKLIKQIAGLGDVDNAGYHEFADHVKQQWEICQELIKHKPEKNKKKKIKPKKFKVQMWDKNAADTFFLGNYVGCCLATDSSQFSAMVQRRFDDAMMFPVVIDPETNKPVALLWLYLAEDKDGVIHPVANFCEVNAKYGSTPDVRQALLNALLYFCDEMYRTSNPKMGPLLMNQLTYGWNVGDLAAHSVQNIGSIKKFGGPHLPGAASELEFSGVDTVEELLAQQMGDNDSDPVMTLNRITQEHYYLVSLGVSQFHVYDPAALSIEDRRRYQPTDYVAKTNSPVATLVCHGFNSLKTPNSVKKEPHHQTEGSVKFQPTLTTKARM